MLLQLLNEKMKAKKEAIKIKIVEEKLPEEISKKQFCLCEEK